MRPEILHKICKSPNVTPKTLMIFANTVLFLAVLPKDIPEPELELGPNGHLRMVWLNNKWVFKGSVMLMTNDDPKKSVDMYCVKIENPNNPKDPKNSIVFSSYSFEDGIPEEILTAIREIMKK